LGRVSRTWGPDGALGRLSFLSASCTWSARYAFCCRPAKAVTPLSPGRGGARAGGGGCAGCLWARESDMPRPPCVCFITSKAKLKKSAERTGVRLPTALHEVLQVRTLCFAMPILGALHSSPALDVRLLRTALQSAQRVEELPVENAVPSLPWELGLAAVFLSCPVPSVVRGSFVVKFFSRAQSWLRGRFAV